MADTKAPRGPVRDEYGTTRVSAVTRALLLTAASRLCRAVPEEAR